jgi:molybdopterin molybdotransferase
MLTQSPYPMISVEQALQAILTRTQPLSSERISFLEGQGRVLAEAVTAAEDLPSSPRSAVDGYAVAQLAAPGTLRVLGELTAGQVSSTRVEPGSAMRIMTGGLLPPGSDAVVMVEDTQEQDGLVHVSKGIQPGDNVHPTGQDLKREQVVLEPGRQLGPPEIGMLATVGHTAVSVFRRPRVAILATGDELVEPSETPPEGSIRDSNRFALIAAAREAGADVVWQRHGPDDRIALERLVREALDVSDVLITSGGVSMGTRDLIKPLLADLGQLQFGRIAFKPGKPLTFVTIEGKLAFGLPGYPVSSLVTFEVFVRPALLRLQGLQQALRPRVTVALEHVVRPDPVRLEYQRAAVRWVGGRLSARSTGSQGSSRLLSMIGANALLEIQPGPDRLPPGTAVPALLTGNLVAD